VCWCSNGALAPTDKHSMSILRKLRGIVTTALTWAVVWAPLSLLPLAFAALSGIQLPPGSVGRVLIIQAVIGAINGGVFASVLAVAGRKKRFETLSLRWIAACGAVGGALFPLVVRAALFTSLEVPFPAMALAWDLVTNAALGAGFATLTLALARRAPALPEGDGSAFGSVGHGMEHPVTLNDELA
jgi:hypothetical protein